MSVLNENLNQLLSISPDLLADEYAAAGINK